MHQRIAGRHSLSIKGILVLTAISLSILLVLDIAEGAELTHAPAPASSSSSDRPAGGGTHTTGPVKAP